MVILMWMLLAEDDGESLPIRAKEKNGPLFDLAIAIAALKELNMNKGEIPIDAAFIGALSLDSMVVKVEGMLPALISARGLGLKKIYLPFDPTIPIHMLKNLECIVVQHIEDVVQLITAKGIYHPRHVFYHCSPRNLPSYANIFTNIYISPTD